MGTSQTTLAAELLSRAGTTGPDGQRRACRTLVLFDGECVMCNAGVRWILRRDRGSGAVRAGWFRFAPLQSRAGEIAATAAGLVPRAGAGELSAGGTLAERLGTMVVIDVQGVHVRSAAALRIMQNLGWPWALLGLAWMLPGGLRDWAYGIVARNRYRWFGRRAACELLPAEERWRIWEG